MHRENANIVDCTLNIAKTAWAERECEAGEGCIATFQAFSFKFTAEKNTCQPQGCSHNITVISANICHYDSALRAQQREVVSRSRSLQISRTSTGRGQPSFSCFCCFYICGTILTLWEQPWGQAHCRVSSGHLSLFNGFYLILLLLLYFILYRFVNIKLILKICEY